MSFSYSDLERTDDHVYYNITIYNPTDADIEAKFIEDRNFAIIDNPEDYHISIIRFSVPGMAIPIFVYPSNPPNSLTPDNNFYWIVLRYSGTDFAQNIIWVPSDIFSPIPQLYEYSYHHFLGLVNTAFASAFTALKAAFPAAPPTQAPYIVFDSATRLFSVYVQELYDPAFTAPAATIEIWFNSNLWRIFEFWEHLFRGNTNIDHRDLQLIVKNYGNNALTVPAGYLAMTQELVGLKLWNSLRKIVVLSNLIPAKKEYVSSLNDDGQVIFRPILTDFEPIIETNAREFIQYFPPGEYRLAELNSNQPLKKIDIQVFWENNRQELLPVFIPGKESVSIKIMFRKKSLIH